MTEGNDSKGVDALLLNGIQPSLRPVNLAVGKVLLVLGKMMEARIEPSASRYVVTWTVFNSPIHF